MCIPSIHLRYRFTYRRHKLQTLQIATENVSVWELTDHRAFIVTTWSQVFSETRKFDHGLTQLLHDDLYWLDVADRVTYKLGVIMHRRRHGKAPQYLVDCCTPVTDVVSSQVVPKSTRTLPTRTQVISIQTRTQVKSYPSQVVPMPSRTQVNSYPIPSRTQKAWIWCKLIVSLWPLTISVAYAKAKLIV